MPRSIFSLDYIGKWIYFKPVKANWGSVKLVFFHGEKYEEQRAFPLAQGVELLEQEEFDNAKPTVIYFHGFLESLDSTSVQCVINSYLKRADHNVIVLDWAEIAIGNYMLQVIPNSEKIGKMVTSLLINMFDSGLDSSKVHLLGHSLGAHMGGLIARRIYKKSNKMFKIKRVSGLDPAFLPFYPAVFYKPLNKNDAELVDIIHTDAWIYGAPISTGHVDFWPNKGKSIQIGCPKRSFQLLTQIDLCSHQRSWRFWSESVENKGGKTFPAVQCKRWKDFRTGKFDATKDLTYMGLDCPVNASGNCYLQTNAETPYSRGMQGIIFDPNRPHEKENAVPVDLETLEIS